MANYIKREDALNINFRINVNLFENRDKVAERAVQAYADAISKIPAADVRPVVRGKWVKDEDGCVCCSLCGNPCEINGITGEFLYSPYCSECGANMRGGDEDV